MGDGQESKERDQSYMVLPWWSIPAALVLAFVVGMFLSWLMMCGLGF